MYDEEGNGIVRWYRKGHLDDNMIEMFIYNEETKKFYYLKRDESYVQESTEPIAFIRFAEKNTTDIREDE